MHEPQLKTRERLIRAVIVEDEAPARSRIIRFLKGHADVEIVGEAATGYEAIALSERTSPNLIVLDIKLPDISGLEVLKSLGERPHVIFSTAYDSYAIEAFEVEAVDFLLKPYEQRRVDTALERVRTRIQSEQAPLGIEDLLRRLGGGANAHRIALHELEQLMEPRRFFRANRSTLVNLDLVREIHPWFGGRFVVRFSQLEPSEQIEVSRRQAKLLSEMLN